ncbi:MAG: arsenate reductase ArsC [Thermoplasmata archaeon]|nr:arsenate reductase ArsC [Thermoplasmata archaeon]
MNKKKVLVLCIHNSARSQMAEGLIRAMYGDRVEVCSAGSKPSKLHPLAVKVMEEIGIDISGHRSKPVSEFRGMSFDLVVTVCGQSPASGEQCPFFPGGKKYIHRSFDDPDKAGLSDSEKEVLFRKVRDEILEWLKTLETEFS